MVTASKATPKAAVKRKAASRPATRSAAGKDRAQAKASPADKAEPLSHYWSRRDFAKTPEPRGERTKKGPSLSFVIQKHAATRLHYDFRLELDGVMLSWAVPKGPSYDPADKRMAVRTEDHPLSYASFEGAIPPKQYGAGTVIVWDRGTWVPVGDPRKGLADGKLLFTLHGEKMAGLWELVRIRKPGEEKQDPWLLFKKRDALARPKAEFDVVTALPDSVIQKPLGDKAMNAIEAQIETAADTIEKPARRARTASSAAHQGIPGAVKAPSPAKLMPQLATLSAGTPPAGDWIYEIKFDGYRLMAHFVRGKVQLITRGGHDWTSKMPDLARELNGLGLKSAWLDGEIVVMGENGSPDFNALQNSFDRAKTAGIVYFLFDVPYFEGYDLRQAPLHARRELLRQLLQPHQGEHVRFSDDFAADATSVLQSACEMHLEGVIAKRRDAVYESRRSQTWLKLKCQRRQEFVIGGFTVRKNGVASEVGSLLLGVHDDAGKLVFCGSVGTGWDSKSAKALGAQLVKIEAKASPFVGDSATKKGRWTRRSEGDERWVQPKLVAEVNFAEWTPDAQIRHAVFVALRTDKPPSAITREAVVNPSAAVPTSERQQAARPAAIDGPASRVKVSNPQRVIDPSTGFTKLDLARYYESVATWILPHLKGRPCSLVRGPSGIAGELFFQKHAEKLRIPDVKDLDPKLWPGHEALLEVGTAKALNGAAQMNVIEFHTWNALAKNIGKPDRMVFDIDPGDKVPWPRVQEAAVLTRALLNELGLQSWLKTSGGKGLHLVVPIAPRHDWDTVKGFSQAVVQHLARHIPDRFVAKSGPSNRIGKIFVDYLRNGHGATTASAFSARARPGLGVSMPVSWEQLDDLKSGAHWTVLTAREYLSFQTEDPWKDYASCKQSLTQPMKVLGYGTARKP